MSGVLSQCFHIFCDNVTTIDLRIKKHLFFTYSRKYRPNLRTYRGHYKEWWHFAYKCVLEEEVLRRRRNWDWTHMLTHRTLCKDYASAYQCKISSKGKTTSEQKCLMDEAEKKLDLLNLVVIRQRIEMEVCFTL